MSITPSGPSAPFLDYQVEGLPQYEEPSPPLYDEPPPPYRNGDGELDPQTARAFLDSKNKVQYVLDGDFWRKPFSDRLKISQTLGLDAKKAELCGLRDLKDKIWRHTKDSEDFIEMSAVCAGDSLGLVMFAGLAAAASGGAISGAVIFFGIIAAVLLLIAIIFGIEAIRCSYCKSASESRLKAEAEKIVQEITDRILDHYVFPQLGTVA
ncbi:MAG: hypothetical protein A3E80_03605 [Chlamydiae bacterium RIFCSPHIGHO2_12_FULL_49_9]|nr:MAG: hypothetical protein A3E80_03605 [Chlamydiae bacterium RIFCSPHIGHO2_12_FULL_49_9]